MPYFVYILECADKSLYTGITNDLERRFNEHFSGKGCRYTKANPPTKARYTEEYPSRSDALKREAQIKSWSRTKKIALIKGDKGILKAAARCRTNQSC
jgi:predicted GIY-YIG superfamily endonuclease